MSLTRDEHIFMAKICEQCDRFEEMKYHMIEVTKKSTDLSTEERNLLSVSFKNEVGIRRTSLRITISLEAKEENKKSSNIELLSNYKSKIESELNLLCDEIIGIINRILKNASLGAEAKIFYLKMIGDYYRYMSEYKTGDEHAKVAKSAQENYEQASLLATSELKTTHPIRLGLALNYSVFYYEVLNDPNSACQMAKKAFDDAIADIEQIEEDQYKDSTTIMQLIRDNLTLWTSELEEADEK